MRSCAVPWAKAPCGNASTSASHTPAATPPARRQRCAAPAQARRRARRAVFDSAIGSLAAGRQRGRNASRKKGGTLGSGSDRLRRRGDSQSERRILNASAPRPLPIPLVPIALPTEPLACVPARVPRCAARATPPGATRARHEPIPRPVRRELPPPECRIAFRLCRVPRAAVPETPIDKHRQPQLGKNKIGADFEIPHSAFRIPNLNVPSPTADSPRPEHAHQGQFRALVATRSDARHDRRTFGFGEDVGHRLTPAHPVAGLPPTVCSGETRRAFALSSAAVCTRLSWPFLDAPAAPELRRE